MIDRYKREKPHGMIIMVTHHLNMLERVQADTVTVLSRGEIVQSGHQSLVQDIITKQAYETE